MRGGVDQQAHQAAHHGAVDADELQVAPDVALQLAGHLARLAMRKVVAVIAKTIVDMAEDPDHVLRHRFDELVEQFIGRLQSDEALRLRGERLKAELLDSPALGRYVSELWDDLLAWLRDDLACPD